MESIVYTLSLLVIAVACVLGVLHHKFIDNLLQTVGLAIACLGASTRVLEVFGSYTNETHARYLFTYGVALFALGAIYKFWKKP